MITKNMPITKNRDKVMLASYLPQRIVTNDEIIKNIPGMTSAVLRRSFGAVERRAIASDETAADMMIEVAKKILKETGCTAKDIDCIICSSDPSDTIEPATGPVVQAKIGASCPAFDISMSCTGWLAGVETGLNYLDAGKKKILVLASCTIGSRIFYRDLKYRAIFGDGAGGILLESQHRSKFIAIDLWTDGRHYSKIFVPHAWTVLPKEIPPEYKNSFYMLSNQKEFFAIMDSYFVPFSENLLKKANIDINDIDLFLLHYPTKPLFERSIKLLGIPEEKTFHRFDKYGNIATAEMPILLDEAIRTGRIKKGDIVYILVYGAGFTGGGLIMEY